MRTRIVTLLLFKEKSYGKNETNYRVYGTVKSADRLSSGTTW